MIDTGTQPDERREAVTAVPARASVVVIGSGPVGLTAATIASRVGPVLLVDSAAVGTRADGIVSAPPGHRGLQPGSTEPARAFGPGGTSRIWGGQLWPWRVEDLPDGDADRAWPLSFPDLARSYDLIASTWPLSRQQRQFLRSTWEPSAYLPRGSGFGVRHSTWLGWGDRNLWRPLGPSRRGPVHHLDAVVTSLLRHGDTVSLLVSSRTGETEIEADVVFCAAGTIGNVSLLATLSARPATLGEGFMDHVSAPALVADVVDARAFHEHCAPKVIGGKRYSPRFVPVGHGDDDPTTPHAYGHWQTLGAGSWRDGARSIARAMQTSTPSEMPAGLRTIARDVPDAARGARRLLLDRRVPFAAGRAVFRIDVEQRPSDSRRLTVDADGDVDLQWQVGQPEEAAFHRLAERGLAQLPWSKLGLADPTPVRSVDFTDIKHLMGGTRMGVDPGRSVVDAENRVHGVRNLFVLGASTFPTGGMANPTVTASALAARSVACALGVAPWS